MSSLLTPGTSALIRYALSSSETSILMCGSCGMLRHNARAQDFVFRLGGDEFMLVLPCPVGEGSALARSVAKRVLTDLQRPVSYLTLSGLRVGCSVGGTIWQPEAGPLAEAMQRANEALHAAKRAGRGQFRHALPAARRPIETPSGEPLRA